VSSTKRSWFTAAILAAGVYEATKQPLTATTAPQGTDRIGGNGNDFDRCSIVYPDQVITRLDIVSAADSCWDYGLTTFGDGGLHKVPLILDQWYMIVVINASWPRALRLKGLKRAISGGINQRPTGKDHHSAVT
jgi:hypothetical protein